MMNKELTDDELNEVTGGIDLSVFNSKNITKLIVALISGNTETCKSLITQLLSEGENPSEIEKVIAKLVRNETLQTALSAYLK